MKVNGEAIRAIRVAQGRTLRDVADAAEVNFGWLSRVETGQKTASDATIEAIAAALSVSPGAISYPEPPGVQATPETIEQIVRLLSQSGTPAEGALL